jgi:hypothetical protein
LPRDRFYHRKDGQIVKLRDDLMSACRQAIMMRRFAKPVMLGLRAPDWGQQGSGIAKGTDFDLWGGSAA